MKVLKDNFTGNKANINIVNQYPKKLICENCDSSLEYDESDIHIGVYGASHVLCPLCGYDNMLDGDEHDITLTKNNIEFPTHFHHTSVETGAVDVCNTVYIRKCVSEAIDYFRENKDEFVYYTGTGNAMIYVFRLSGDEEYEVVVSDSYYSTYIKFEEEDYGGNNNRFTGYSLNEGVVK